MGWSSKVRSTLVASGLATGIYVLYVRSHFAHVERLEYLEQVSEYWSELLPSHGYTIYGYRVPVVLPSARVAHEAFASTEYGNCATIRSDGAKIVSEQSWNVPGQPIVGSLYALQALQHSTLLRRRAALRVWFHTLRPSNVYDYLATTSRRHLSQVRRSMRTAIAQAVAEAEAGGARGVKAAEQRIVAEAQNICHDAAAAGAAAEVVLYPRNSEAVMAQSARMEPTTGLALVKSGRECYTTDIEKANGSAGSMTHSRATGTSYPTTTSKTTDNNAMCVPWYGSCANVIDSPRGAVAYVYQVYPCTTAPDAPLLMVWFDRARAWYRDVRGRRTAASVAHALESLGDV